MFNMVRKGEKATKTCAVDTNEHDMVTMQHTSIHPEFPKDSRAVLTWRFNFDDVKESELLELAAKHLVIQMRVKFKNTKKPKPEEWDGREFSVRDYIDNEKRTAKDPVKTLIEQLKALSPEQRAIILGSAE